MYVGIADIRKVVGILSMHWNATCQFFLALGSTSLSSSMEACQQRTWRSTEAIPVDPIAVVLPLNAVRDPILEHKGYKDCNSFNNDLVGKDRKGS